MARKYLIQAVALAYISLNSFLPNAGTIAANAKESAAIVADKGLLEKRVIDVCILYDSKSEVDSISIRDTLSSVIEGYKTTGIELNIKTYASFERDVQSSPIDIGFYVKKICGDCELRMIFTNEKVLINQNKKTGVEKNTNINFDCNYESQDLKDKLALEMSASSSDYYGFLIAYNVRERSQLKDNGGNSAIQTAVNHEIGHIFGLGHSSDKNSFMYCPSNKSRGRWTKETIEGIISRKNKVWFPKPQN